MRTPTSISLYLHEDLELGVKGNAEIMHFSMGGVISTAIIWACSNCGDPKARKPEDVGVMLESEREYRRIHKAGYPARRTAAQLTADAFDILQTLTLGDMPRMTVINSCLSYFLRHCKSKRAAVEAIVMHTRMPGRPRNAEPIAPIPVHFPHDVVQQLRGVSAATGLSVQAVINDIVTRALTDAAISDLMELEPVKLPNQGETIND